jgi:3-phosphoshikimate 1-carboxyvinyltransferase
MTGWWSSSTEAPPAPVSVPDGRRAAGAVRPPSSKSLTHRACAIAVLSREPIVIERPLDAEDTRLFVAALERLGFAVGRMPERIELAPPKAFPGEAVLHCGNAGTFFRFLIALAATIPSRIRIDGAPRLRERPAGPLVAALRALGVAIDEEGAAGCAPLVVHGGALDGGAVRLDAGESSQYLSALLLAGTRARSPLAIEVPRLASSPYVDLTIAMLERFGGRVDRPAPGRWVVHPARLAGGAVEIEADLSAAAYPAAAAALTGGTVEILGVSPESKQGDRRFLDLLRTMGAGVTWGAAAVVVRGATLAGIDADLSEMPDQVPTLAALAPFARGTTRISNVAHLRIKESDRLAAMTAELRRAGAAVEELADGLVIPGVWAEGGPPFELPSAPVTIDPHDDHRIAMAMALVGLRRPGLAIADPGCVGKSYPGFWRDLAALLGDAA